jgi:RNA polymerase sigma factor for flagellar operon FliA
VQNTQPRAAVESIFLEQLESIEKIVSFISRKHGLVDADAEDFLSLVKTKLIENDYAVIRKFRGESSLSTFLAVVIAGIYRDYRVQRWGRWRPSAIARRLGHEAILLETLLFRDGYSTAETVEIMRTLHHSDLSEKDIRSIILKIPRRERLRPREVSVNAPDSESQRIQDTEVEDPVADNERLRLETALTQALNELASDDRALLTMKFWRDMTIADISRIAGLPQKQLYRRLEKLVALLKARLVRAGVSDEDVRDLIGA